MVRGLARCLILLAGLAGLGCSGSGKGLPADARVAIDGAAPVPRVLIAGPHSVRVGSTVTLSASTEHASDRTYVWTSADEQIATVDPDGTVTGVAVGETEVRARGGDSGAGGAHVVVVTGGGAIVVAVAGEAYVLVGKTTKLTATTVNGSDSGYRWTSDAPAVATVAADGTVTGVAPGLATVSAEGLDSKQSGGIGITVALEVPHFEKWRTSAHADKVATAFNHWNDATPPQIPAACARCHSTPGFLDFLGADGTAAQKVDGPAPTGTVIDCVACHNPTADALSSVTFPSGVTIAQVGADARCITCHQGRASLKSVDDAITNAAPADDDSVSAQLDFVDIHYHAAAATLYAGRVTGGYQYPGKVYDWRFRHAPGVESCVGCHDPHSLTVKLQLCATCHAGVGAAADAKNIRMTASQGRDYDGDGNMAEGIYHEIDGLRGKLIGAINAYVTHRSLAKICYTSTTEPYFFVDTDGSGACGGGEVAFGNRYASWTARLLRAAYNYHVAVRDGGGFAHNAKYLIQLLYDSIADLNQQLPAAERVDMSQAVRDDVGHFNGAGQAARHWDGYGAVSQSCARCHGGSVGLRFYLKYGVGPTGLEQDDGLDCATCHETLGIPGDAGAYDLIAVDSVSLPGGAKRIDPGNANNLCGTCHSGLHSTATLDAAIGANDLGFKDVHGLPAYALKLGSGAGVGYQYAAQVYSGEWTTHAPGNTCVTCHAPAKTGHSFAVADNQQFCKYCHSSVASVGEIRAMGRTGIDYDGDTIASETLADELATLAFKLIDRIRIVAGANPICYADSYPYFFKDDGDGICSAIEIDAANAYGAWTPALMRAAHNYQLSQRDRGAWAHNFDYMVQLLQDSIAALGGSTLGMTRP